MRLRKLVGLFGALCMVAALLVIGPAANAQEAEDAQGDGDASAEAPYTSPPEMGSDDTPWPSEAPEGGEGDAGPQDEVDPMVAVHAAGDTAVFAGDSAGYEAAASELRSNDRGDLADGLDDDWNQLTTEEDDGGGNAGNFGINGAACAFGSLSAAITAASAGDTVYIAPGNYNSVNVNVSKNLTIQQGNSNCGSLGFVLGTVESNVLLNGGAASDAVIEVFGGANVTLRNISVLFGNGSDGNIRVFQASNLTLNNVRSASGTNSASGGGLLVENGTVTIAGAGPGVFTLPNFETRIENNNALGNGGGIAVLADGVLTGNRLNISNNVADNTALGGLGDFSNGGGLSVANGGDATVFLMRVSSNTASIGGGVYVSGGGLDLDSPKITDNKALGGGGLITASGGGLYVATDGTASIDGNAEISNNAAAATGGGIIVGNAASLNISGSADSQPEINNNTSGTGAGIALLGATSATLNTVEISGNVATGNGGAAYIGNTALLRITETSACSFASVGPDEWCNEIVGNEAAAGQAVYADGGDLQIEQAAIQDHAAAINVIELTGDAVSRIQTSLFTGNSQSNSDAIIRAADSSDLTLISTSMLSNSASFAVDQDNSATVSTSRMLLDSGYNGGTYSGVCNVSTSATNVPSVTVTGDLRLAGGLAAAHSEWEPKADSPAGDVCAGNEGSSADIIDRSIDNADGIGATQYDAGAYEIRTGLGYTCGGLNATIVGTGLGETISGTGGNDVIVAQGGADIVNAGAGADTVCGGNGGDTLNGGTGDDDLRGQGSVDILNGGPDNDIIFGGPGGDTLNGDGGDDDLRGQSGGDFINGGTGIDNILGQSGNDTITTGTGGNRGTTKVVQGGGNNDIITGSPQDDELEGNAGLDEVRGGDGNDILKGGLANDELYGDDGDDELFGEGNNDMLYGGNQDDVLNGGTGDDDLFGESGSDDLNGQGDTDLCDGGSGAGDTATASCETLVDIP